MKNTVFPKSIEIENGMVLRYPHITWDLGLGHPAIVGPMTKLFDRLATAYPMVTHAIHEFMIIPAGRQIDDTGACLGDKVAASNGWSMVFNADYFGDIVKIRAVQIQAAKDGWHPRCADDPAFQVAHEFGHFLLRTLSKDEEIPFEYTLEEVSEVSGYAAKKAEKNLYEGALEAFADAFADIVLYRPRPVALPKFTQEVGRITVPSRMRLYMGGNTNENFCKREML